MIATVKIIVARSVFLLSVVFGGWLTSSIVSVPITTVEYAMMRGCEDDGCGDLLVAGPNGEIIDTGVDICSDNPDSGTKCNMEGIECTTKNCCPWWKFWC